MDFETIDGLSEEEIKTLYDVENLKIADCICSHYLYTNSCGLLPGSYCVGYWNGQWKDVSTHDLCREWCHVHGFTIKTFNNDWCGCDW